MWNIPVPINELHFTWYIEHMSRICENFMQASAEKVNDNWLEDPWMVSAQQPRDTKYDHWMSLMVVDLIALMEWGVKQAWLKWEL